MRDIEVEIGTLKLKNPMILASAGYASTEGGLRNHINKGFGAVVTKTVTTAPLKGAPKPTVFWYDKDEKRLLSGVEGLKNPGIDKMAEAVEAVFEYSKSQNCKIIGSCTGNSVDEVYEICEKFKKAGVSAIELNMVCPNAGPHLGKEYNQIGKWWSQDSEHAIKLISGLKKRFNLPVWMKLPLIKLIDKSFINDVDKYGKPDAYSFVGGRLPSLKIDVETGKPVFPGNWWVMIDEKIPISPFVTGPIKPSTILHTAYINKITKTPLVCSGDLTKGEDVLEAVMAGASAVQICKAVYRDADACPRILNEIENLMNKNSYSDFKKIRGAVSAYLPEPPMLTVPNAIW